MISADEWRLFRQLRQEALREAPYAFGSTLANWQGDGDAEQRWRDRLTEVPFNVVAYYDGAPAGIVSGTHPDENGQAELISMWVAPLARGKGIGEALVDALVRWAKAQGAEHVALDVREGNERAIRLYERCGFSDRGQIATEPGAPPERKMLRAITADSG